MRVTLHILLFTLGFSSLALSQSSLKKDATTDNTSLYSDSISVIFFMLDECRICQYYGPEFQEYANTYIDDQISFVGYFPNFSSKKKSIAQFKEKYNIPFDLKTDYYKTQSKKFEAEVLPTVVVYDEIHEVVLYSGRIDDRYHKVGQQKRVISSYDLKNALDSIVAGEPITVKKTQPIGCFINFADNISR